MKSRRDFIRKSVMGVAAVSFPRFPAITEVFTSAETTQVFLSANNRILFQGDSITDAGRDKIMMRPNYGKGMGKGYALLAASKVLNENPKHNLFFYNRGVSGDTVERMLKRWEQDCIAIKPHVVSLLVGVNDYNSAFMINEKGNAEKFEYEYEKLLHLTVDKLPDVKLIIGEPFALKGITGLTDNWKDFHLYSNVAKKLAHQFKAAFVPYQSAFNEAIRDVPAGYYSTDGVHPSLAGIYLMSKVWLDAVTVR